MIRSTFAGFTTAQLGMAASQRALDVTGQNITNINTPGYTRQRLDIASLNTQKGDYYNSKSNIKVGFGVEMTGISQLRDPFLDAQYRSQISKLGTSDAHAAGFELLTPIFDEATMSGVRDAFISLTSALNTLSTPAGIGNDENDAMVRSKMQILLNLFRENSVRLEDVRENVQTGFATTDVGDLNQLLDNIANLNVSIKNSQILGNPALELQDQRNSLLDELGSYLPISVKYSDQEIGPNQYVEVLDVVFTDTDGVKHSLISDSRAASFDAIVNDKSARLMLSDAKGGTTEVTDILGSGTLKGTLDLINKSGDFDGSDFRGIGYYEKALDSLVATFADKFNEMNIPKDANGNPTNLKDKDGKIIVPPGGKFLTDANGNTVVELDDQGNPKTDTTGNTIPVYAYPLFETKDGSTTFTASNIKIAEGWANGTYKITASNNYVVTDKETGSTANENILNMVKLLENKISFEVDGKQFYSGSFHDCFANLEATLGIDYKSESTMLANQISVLNQTSNSRDGVSGVQLDEEGMNLLHYNQSYTAAARLMTTLDEALDVLINRTGVVGR
ncbi:flagellar hook-associated protein FlgK [Lachnospiraceae bacterium 56-18]